MKDGKKKSGSTKGRTSPTSPPKPGSRCMGKVRHQYDFSPDTVEALGVAKGYFNADNDAETIRRSLDLIRKFAELKQAGSHIMVENENGFLENVVLL